MPVTTNIKTVDDDSPLGIRFQLRTPSHRSVRQARLVHDLRDAADQLHAAPGLRVEAVECSIWNANVVAGMAWQTRAEPVHEGKGPTPVRRILPSLLQTIVGASLGGSPFTLPRAKGMSMAN
jgi:hypothetical protein